MIHQEGRLDQMLFYISLKEQVQDIALLMTLLEFNIVCFRKLSCLLQRLHFIPVHSAVFLHCVYHGDALKRLAKIHLHAVIYDLRGT